MSTRRSSVMVLTQDPVSNITVINSFQNRILVWNCVPWKQLGFSTQTDAGNSSRVVIWGMGGWAPRWSLLPPDG